MPAIIATNTLLTEARKAYHAIVTGTSPSVVVDGQDGSRVEYNKANAASLYNYIQMLEAQLNPSGCGIARNIGPAHFTF